MSEPLTLMIVHAHPDDECISTGGVIPRYSTEGVRVVLVIATGGEEGEIVLPEIDIPNVRANFARYRAAELEQSAIILGVSHLELLGYRDSGMVGTESNTHPDCFNMADPDEAAGRLVKLVRHYQPQVLISYNEVGGYGHPDHIACHKATVAAFEAAGDGSRYPDAGAPWTPRKLYYTNSPRKPLRAAWERMRELGIPSPLDDPNFDINRFTVADEVVTTRISISDYLPQKMAALRAHRSQIRPDRFFLSVPEELRPEFFGYEYFTRVASRVAVQQTNDERRTTEDAGAGQNEGQYEDDLFTGVRG